MKKFLLSFFVLSFILLFFLMCMLDKTDLTKSSLSGNNDLKLDRELTLMVYLDGDNNLEEFAIDDFNEMEAVNLADTGIDIIVLADRVPDEDTSNGNWTNTRLYKINYDTNGYDSTIISERLSGMGLTTTGNEELNMGDEATLSNFINF